MAQKKKVMFELGFKTDTQEAKRKIGELHESLKQISNIQIGLKGGDLDIARQSARDLSLELQKAVNVDTGKLDLTKLTRGLKANNKDLLTLSSNLIKIGPQGQQTFLQLAQAVGAAEVPMVKLNKGVQDFIENLAKTAKWQIAQAAIHGVQQGLSGAIREAEQLNKALNDIRIVTGYDKTTMAQFAKEANKAAKELKTTTKQYAEASLIFYQQGLSSAEAAKRAETVLKMSQVTGDSAKAVSDQMTAIWNNFADGSKTLEYYADAMAKLGAVTAANTSEIANGLEKFAAIAKTVGLSYETAMASVATVIDKTRQSADVVGTAFKTIFARIQGLNMDGVTDDGVSLNKYSAALEKIGVDVLTASGELRDMDEILNDLGSKWEGLGREAQVAVAQVVGGARQYNQLLSLMDNWSTVQSNIIKAEGSTGEISKQASIWAESYEAAAKRVEEAKARATENFLSSDSVVTLTNAFADLIESTDSFVDSMGGIIPLGLTIMGLFSHKLIPIVKTGYTSLKENFFTFIGGSESLLQKTQSQLADYLKTLQSSGIEDSLAKQYELNRKLILVKQNMAEATKYMSIQERESAIATLAIYEESVQAAIAASKKVHEAERDVKKANKKTASEKVRVDAKNKAENEFFADKNLSDEDRKKVLEYAKNESIDARSIENEETKINNAKTHREQLERDRVEQEEKHQKYLEAKANYDRALETPGYAPQGLSKLKKTLEESKVEKANFGDREKELKREEAELVDPHELELQKQALAFRQLNKTTPKNARKISFGTRSIEEDFTMTENEDEETAKEFNKIKETVFSEVTAGDETLEFLKTQNEELEISVHNFEALIRQSANYEVQANRLNKIVSELDSFSITDVESLEEEKKTAEQEVEAAKASVKKSKNDPKEVEKLAAAEEKLAKVENKLNKAQTRNATAVKRSTKLLKANKTELLKLAKSVGYTEEDLEALNKEIDELSESDPKGVEKLKNKMATLAKTTRLTSESLGNMAKNMQEDLGSNLGAENMQAEAEAMEKLKQAIIEDAEAKDNATMAEDDFNDAMGKTSETFEKIAGVVGEAAGALTGFYGGINSIFNAFEEGNGPIEVFLGLLGGIVAIAPAVGLAIKAVSAINSMATKKKIADNAAEAKSEVVTGGVVVSTEAAKSAAKLNPVGIAAAIVAAGILAAVGGAAIVKNISDNKKEAKRKENEEAIELANQSNELAKNSQAESQELSSLISQYNKLNAEKADTTEINKDIISQTDSLIEKYKEYSDNIKMTTEYATELSTAIAKLQHAQVLGDIEGIKTAQEAADYAIAKNAQSLNNSGKNAVLSQVRYKEDANQVSVKDGYVQRRVGGVGSDETKAIDLLKTNMGDAIKNSSRKNTVKVQLNTSNPETFMKQYEGLQSAVQAMQGDDVAKNSDTLRECLELLSTYKEEYEALKTYQTEGKSLSVLNTVGALAAQGVSTSNVTDYASYKSYKTSISARLGNDQEKQDALYTWLSSNEDLSKYAEAEKKIAALHEKTGTDLSEYQDLFEEKQIYKDGKLIGTEEGLDLETFLKVNLNLYTEPEEITAEAERIENELAREKIKVNLQVYDDILDKIKPEGMTEEDWQEISESELFKNDPQGFKAFTEMSYANQLAHITDLQTADKQAERQSIIDQMNSAAATVNDQTSTATAKEDARRQYYELEKKLAILDAINKKEEEYRLNLRKSDVGDIYRNLNKELEKLQKNYDKLTEAQNDLFGSDAIAIYDDLLKNLEEQNDALEYKNELNNQEIAFQQSKFTQQTKESLGIDLEYDEDGQLSNASYQAVLAKLTELGKTQDITQLREQFEENFGDYNGLLEDREANNDSLEANARKAKELNFQKITAKLDLQLELKDLHLKQITNEISKSMESIWSYGKGPEGFDKQLNIISNSYSMINEELTKLDEAYAAGQITEADYIARQKQLYDEALSNQEALDGLSDSLIEYYSNALAKASEEIAKYTDRMDAMNSTLEHYKTLLDLVGESSGKAMEEVLKTSTNLAEKNYKVSKEVYESAAAEEKRRKDELDNYVKEKGASLDKANDEEYKALEQSWLIAKEAEENAQNEMLTDAEAWGTAMKEQITFAVDQAAKVLEDGFTGGIGFDALTSQMSRRATLAEEILTDTNRLYETTKMIRDAENAMLKTDNARSKQKLKTYIDEVKNLQNTTNLSKTQLSIQQKEYDLVLAKIALEEAQNAKSTVRLQRTADGGFGYVYTADENAVNDAKQGVDDAENELYNARIEAANEYTEKRVQLQQQMTQELADLNQKYLNGEIESQEEYEELQAEIMSNYSALFDSYLQTYNFAVDENATILEEAWSTHFQDTVTSLGTWDSNLKTFTDGLLKSYTESVNGTLKEWSDFTNSFKKEVGIDFAAVGDSADENAPKVGELNTALTNINTSAGNITKTLLGDGDKDKGLVGAMDGFIEKAGSFVTEKADTLLSKVKKLGSYFGTLADKILATVQNASGLNNITVPGTPDPKPGPGPTRKPAPEGSTSDSYVDHFKDFLAKLMNGEKINIDDYLTESDEHNVAIKEALSDATTWSKAYSGAIKNGEMTRSQADEDAASRIDNFDGSRISYSRDKLFSDESNTYQKAGDDSGGPQPNQITVPDTFSWDKVLESWKNGGSNIIDDNGNEFTLEEYYKKYGVEVAAQQGQWYYNKDNYQNISTYFDNLQKDSASAFDYNNYLKAYETDIFAKGEKKDVLKKVYEYLSAKKELPMLALTSNTNFTNEDKKILDILSRYKDYIKDFSAIKSMSYTGELVKKGIIKSFLKEGEAPAVLLDFIPSNSLKKTESVDGLIPSYTIQEYLQDDPIIKINNDSIKMETDYTGNDYTITMDQLNRWITAFNTGGYTGKWGPEGKMAMLHEKEIVLNKEDTVNLLDSIKLLRSILTTIDLQAANAQFSSLSSTSFAPGNSSNGVLEQNVHIDAHFDNVTNRDEIVEAFNTLVNRASQYANRKQ